MPSLRPFICPSKLYLPSVPTRKPLSTRKPLLHMVKCDSEGERCG